MRPWTPRCLVTVLLVGCTPTSPENGGLQTGAASASAATSASSQAAAPPSKAAASADSDPERVTTGVLRFQDAIPSESGKQFVGAELERDDGTRWVLAYGRDSIWKAFDGRRVEVRGTRYAPEDQALVAPHFRVETLRVVDDKAGPLSGFGAERELKGIIRRFEAKPNSKAAGFGLHELVEAGGKRWLLESSPPDAPMNRAVTVRARPVEPEWRWAARVGGDYLWILEAKAR
jgi:hypothetical protein